MKTRLIKQAIKKDGKISKRSRAMDDLGMWELNHEIHKQLSRRLDSHLRLFWLMGICIGLLTIISFI